MRRSIVFAGLCLLCVLPLCAQQEVLPLWPEGLPEPAHIAGPERDATKASDALVAGRKLQHLTDVASPSMAFFPAPPGRNSGTAVVVFPGGGYQILAYDLEGTEVCAWLNGIGVNCAVVKYRVPEAAHFPESTEDLEDAQQAVRLVRLHAAAWHVDPARVGVLGFSAGAHLAVVLGNHSDFAKAGAPAMALAGVSARPAFVLVIYPGYLVRMAGGTAAGGPGQPTHELSAGIDPSRDTPPSFLLQAEDDPVHVENVLVYYDALKRLRAPAELHVYAAGGHGYGLRGTALPVTHWPELAETWLKTIHMLPGPGETP